MAERSDHDPQAPSSQPIRVLPDEPQSPISDQDAGDADDTHGDAHDDTSAFYPASPSSSHSHREADAREDTEMARLRRNYSRASTYHPQGSSTSTRQPTTHSGRFTYTISKFWKRQVSVIVPHDKCRDHLALERTFLGYLRTSLALSMIGVIVAQLFRLQHAPLPHPVFGFFVLGKPLACICQGAAFLTTAIGGYRSWRMQNAMIRGKAISGGFEIILLAGGTLLILLTFFILLIAVDITKEHIN